VTFVPAHTVLGDPEAPHQALVVHGILGSGRNWRSLARTLTARHPDWRFVLADLRHHGRSGHPPPPDTLAACAADLRALGDQVGRPEVVVGHSFGGKVALEWARSAAHDPVLWILDAPPGAVRGEPSDAAHDALGVLEALRSVPVPAADRSEMRDALRARGLPEPIVAWLLTSAERSPEGWRWVFDLDAIDAMLDDYFRADLWPFLRETLLEVHLVQAGRGGRWSPEELAAASTVPAGSRVTLHTLPDAGHWLHVDDPEGTLGLIGLSL
jgi:pimeloyl-ACP methyl ester carboxylesterase